MMNGENDLLLVKDFKAGKVRAFDVIFEKYRLSVYSICWRYVRNEEDAHELTQDVFLKVFRNLDKFNEKSKLFTWLYRIVVNTCLSYKRKSKVQDPADLVPPTPISMEERLIMKKAIDDALTELPDRQRLTFILRHFEGYKFDEIAELMGVTSGAAKANHHHAVLKLRDLLREWL